MHTSDVPEPVKDLRSFLEDAGFVKTLDNSGDMGGVEQDFAKVVNAVEVAIRISADRGHWALLIKVPSVQRWIVPGAWAAYLDRTEMRDVALNEQASFVKARLHEVIAHSTDIQLETRLTEIGAAYMRKFLEDTNES